MPEPEVVYIIAIVGYDMHYIKYATLSKDKSLELFEDVRKELIEEVDGMIAHCIAEGRPEYVKDYEDEKNELIAMKPGDEVHHDRPDIQEVRLS